MNLFSRRGFCAATAATLSSAAIPSLLPHPARAEAHKRFTAGKRVIEVNGRAANVYGLTQADGTPGLVMNAGENFRVRLENRLGEPTIVDLITAGDVDIVVNTPSGQGARADGYEIRAATTAADKAIVTTVQQLGAAVQAIEAAQAGPFAVTGPDGSTHIRGEDAAPSLMGGRRQKKIRAAQGGLAGRPRWPVALAARGLVPRRAAHAGARGLDQGRGACVCAR